MGGGTGSGVLLIVIIMMCVYWKCRKHARKAARSTSLNVNCTDPENLNVLHTRKGSTRSFDVTDLGREAVRIQRSDRPIKKVNFDDQLQGFEPPAILDQLEKLGIDVSAHCRSLRARYLALLSNQYDPQDKNEINIPKLFPYHQKMSCYGYMIVSWVCVLVGNRVS